METGIASEREVSPGARPLDFRRISSAGGISLHRRQTAEEAPIALEFDGIGYAVLMATPSDLEDLIYGFALSERLIDRKDQIRDVETQRIAQGWLLRAALGRDVATRVHDRIRHRATDSSCGLCGVENLEQALRPLPPVRAVSRANDDAIFRALAELGDLQPLNRMTGAVHAAAACGPDGRVRLVREDVGRHNAFDKLIGAMLRAGRWWDEGFALLSSRCSYELVEKAVLSDCPMLVTISAATTLAVERAAAAGLALRVLARSDTVLAVGAS